MLTPILPYVPGLSLSPCSVPTDVRDDLDISQGIFAASKEQCEKLSLEMLSLPCLQSARWQLVSFEELDWAMALFSHSQLILRDCSTVTDCWKLVLGSSKVGKRQQHSWDRYLTSAIRVHSCSFPR